MGRKRIQLTLFVDAYEASTIENIRKTYNPEQYRLIKAHVTLCREDELLQIEKVIENIAALPPASINILFGAVTRFCDGKGVLLPATCSNEPFDHLREYVLKHAVIKPRKHQPHITLMHPRNSTCTDSVFNQIEKVPLPTTLCFKTITLIEQEDDNEWKVIKEFVLK